MKRHELSEYPHRLHPIWMILRLLNFIKHFFIALILFVILQIYTDSFLMITGTVILGLYLVYRFISIFLYWWNFKYLFTDKDLCIIEGKLFKEERFISLERIQSVQVKRTFLHRLFGLARLSINTASTGFDSSVVLEMISFDEAKRIKAFLSVVEASNVTQPIETEEVNSENENLIYEMKLKEILLTAITSLKLFALIPLLLAFSSKLGDLFTFKGFMNEVVFLYEQAKGTLFLIVMIAFILSIIIGIGWTYLRLGNFRVVSGESRIFITKGVFSHTELFIQKNRVQAIKLNKNILRQWLGLVEVEIVSAGGVGIEDIEEASILFPLITEKKALALLPEILPGYQVDNHMVKLPFKALYVKWLRPSYIWIIGTAALLYFLPGYWVLSLILLLIMSTLRLLQFLNSGFQISGPFIQLQRGTFTTELMVTKWWKIDELEVRESWLQRHFGLSTLEISTRAKPIHVMVVKDIPRDVGVHYYHWFAERTQCKKV